MSRYIDADKYEQELHRLTEIVHETGHAPGISGEIVKSMRGAFIAGVKAAITQLSVEPGWERVDVADKQMLDAWHADMKGAVTYIKERMAERLGRYAAEHNCATYREGRYGGGAKIIVMRATFMVPIPEAYKPPEQEGGEQE